MSAEELIRACAKSNDEATWTEFVARFQKSISLSILRTAYRWGYAGQQVIEDLIQETYLKLCANKCKLLLEFAVQNPDAVSGYVKATAVNVAHDYFKSLHARKRGSGEVEQLREGFEPRANERSSGGREVIEREILLRQINDCLEASSEGPERERDCLIFWLYYQQGMSAKTIASLPAVGLTAKGVESAIFRLTRQVREALVCSRTQSNTKTGPGDKGFRPAESY